jgi:hypothetical protein
MRWQVPVRLAHVALDGVFANMYAELVQLTQVRFAPHSDFQRLKHHLASIVSGGEFHIV